MTPEEYIEKLKEVQHVKRYTKKIGKHLVVSLKMCTFAK